MTDLDIYQPNGAALAVPDPFDTDSWITVVQDIIKIANVIFDTPFVPDGLRGSAPAVAAAMLAGREMGLGIMTSLANIDVIKGKPTQKALLMRAMIQSKGHKWEDVDVSPTRVIVRGCRKGESVWGEGSFTAAEAKIAGIDLGKYPVDKLYARATSRLARRKFADVIMGMPYSAEELEDGVTDEGSAETPAVTAPAAPPRTAQRRGRAQNVPPAESATPPAQAVTATPPPSAAAGGTPLPPLPGEDDGPGPAPSGHPAGHEPAPGPGPARATPGQVGIIQSHFKRLGFGDGERDQRLVATAVIAGRDRIGSTKELTQDEAKAVTDTLARCRDRERLIVLLAAGDKPEPGDE